MVNNPIKPPPTAARRRSVAVAVLVGCTVSLLCALAASARPAHARPTSVADHGGAGQTPGGESTEQGQVGARAGTLADGHRQSSGSREEKSAGSHESTASGNQEQQGPGSEQRKGTEQHSGDHEPQTPAGSGSQGSAVEEHHAKKRERSDRAGSQGPPAESGAPANQGKPADGAPAVAGAPAIAGAPATGGNSERDDSGNHKGREAADHKRHVRGHRERGGGSGSEQPSTVASPQTAKSPAARLPATVGASQPVSDPASLQPVPVASVALPATAASPTGTLAPTITSAPTITPAPAVTPAPPASSRPVVIRATSQPSRHGRRASVRAARVKGSHGRAPSVAAPVVSTAAATSAATRPTARPRTRRATDGARAPARPSAIVTTITKIVGVVPTGLWILLGALLALAGAMTLRSRIVGLRARRLERQRGELAKDVGLLQAALLPLTPARLGPVATSSAYRPADGPAAGGDFYDLFALEDGTLAVIVGDVSGHGRQALPHTALIRFTLRAYLEAGLSPREALQTTGTVLGRQLGGSFATIIAATYHPRDRLLVYACAGHPPPIVQGSKPIVPLIVRSAPPIGAGMRTGTRQTVVSLPGSSQVCMYTDGLTEARVGSELYGTERLASALAELGPNPTAPALLERVSKQTTSRPDDMAACLLCVEGDARAPEVLLEEAELDCEEAGSEQTEEFLLACGVERSRVGELMRSARSIAGSAGTVLVELRFSEGSPEVILRRDNVAFLHASDARRRASRGASR